MKKEDLILTLDSEEEYSGSESEVENEIKEIDPSFEFSLGDEVDEIKDWEVEEPVKNVDLDEIIQKKREEEEEEEEEDEEQEAEVETEDIEANTKYQSDSEDDQEAIDEFYESTTKETTSKTFQDLQLSRPILKSLQSLSFNTPTPIQSSTIPIALLGKDIVAGAQTGSGKTAAYLIPLIERLIFKNSTSTKAIILTPTRELAIQVYDVGRKLGQFVNNLNFGLAVGGLNLKQQEQQLKTRPDIVIATPGRLIDHIRNSPSFSVEDIQVLVIDEADRMLEEGFQEELTEILSLIPKHKRQTLLFSATMNTKIQDLVQLSLNKPIKVMIDPPKTVATKLEQQFVRIRKRENLKPALLFALLSKLDGRIVVFVSRKEMAHKLRIILGLLGLKVAELHGALTQDQRLSNVKSFKEDINVLICTDLAARGLDIRIEYVINFDMPKTYEIYLHRVGRTARAGRKGTSISFVGESNQDRAIVKAAITNGKSLARKVDWNEIENINNKISSKEKSIEEVLEEEKQAKEILRAEMQLNKAENLMKYEKEIHSRPKRTWFKNEVMEHLTKHGKKVNSKKRKANEVKKDSEKRSYKKTKNDRAKKSKRK
ncbi:DRS1 [Candida pseudojiufengensis]|uniref:DRS1 n=1 Tax=Candida pseudojiufengensis TaxID=497109 RepID=UPI002224F5D1|nr:DRS1 [Candida pseudojiufengensis]KAI5959085.1 DRS1 [Candida pseudojiufengensis]